MEIRKAMLKEAPVIAGELWKNGIIKHHKRYRVYRKFIRHKKNARKMFEDFVRRNIRSPNGLVLVAEDKGKLVGYSLNYIKKDVPVFIPDKTGYLSDLFVKKEYRGKGISSGFKKRAIKWFRKKGIKIASIAAHTENKEARKIYSKWGFEEYHIELRKKI